MSVVDPPLSVMTKYNRSRNVREIVPIRKEIRYLSDRKRKSDTSNLPKILLLETFGVRRDQLNLQRAISGI